MLYKLLHKSHIEPVPYPTMHHFVTEMCTFLLQSGALWDICPVHYGMGLIDLPAIWETKVTKYDISNIN